MVSCILRHRGVQLKLAYSWARPAILVAGKGKKKIYSSFSITENYTIAGPWDNFQF